MNSQILGSGDAVLADIGLVDFLVGAVPRITVRTAATHIDQAIDDARCAKKGMAMASPAVLPAA